MDLALSPTLIGFSAVLMWSLLALFTAASGAVPPFQLLAMTFLIGGLVGLASWPVRGVRLSALRLPAAVWLTGIGGLFGYHFFYYTALRNAPVAEAGLIAYLWPMLIVVGSALLPGERVRLRHVMGVVLGFGGAVLLLLSRQGADAQTGGTAWLGYGSAFACAFFWSGYSVLARTQKTAPTDAVALYCLATAVLALLCHLAFERTVWPQGAVEWLAVAGLGLMPVGLAFYAWDFGVKHGDIQLLGTSAYFAPLLSTLILVAAGLALPTWALVAACLMITAGALIAAGAFGRGRRGDARTTP